MRAQGETGLHVWPMSHLRALLTEAAEEGSGRAGAVLPTGRPSEESDGVSEVHSTAELQLTEVRTKAWHRACLL